MRESKECKIKEGSCSRPYLNTSTYHWFKYRLDTLFPNMKQTCTLTTVWLACFLITLHKTFRHHALVHSPQARRYGQAENEHGTMPFILAAGCHIIVCERAGLSLFHVNTARDVKLTYMSGSGGRPACEYPCCVTTLVTERQVRTLVILMCNNSRSNRPRPLAATVGIQKGALNNKRPDVRFSAAF